MNASDRFAIKTTKSVGSVRFFLTLLISSSIWLGWNIFAPQEWCFDPPPNFQAWLFLSNIIQIMLMPLIMIGQNLQAVRTERLIEQDFKLDKDSRDRGDEIIILLKSIDKRLKKTDKSNKI